MEKELIENARRAVAEEMAREREAIVAAVAEKVEGELKEMRDNIEWLRNTMDALKEPMNLTAQYAEDTLVLCEDEIKEKVVDMANWLNGIDDIKWKIENLERLIIKGGRPATPPREEQKVQPSLMFIPEEDDDDDAEPAPKTIREAMDRVAAHRSEMRGLVAAHASARAPRTRGPLLGGVRKSQPKKD
jgi:CCR4-NOT transcriptional regulation complex NOT5 subunit